jgi:hypothetical protein
VDGRGPIMILTADDGLREQRSRQNGELDHHGDPLGLRVVMMQRKMSCGEI